MPGNPDKTRKKGKIEDDTTNDSQCHADNTPPHLTINITHDIPLKDRMS